MRAKSKGWKAKRFEQPRSPKAGSDVVRLYGLHAVEAALANPARRIRGLYATPNAAQRLEDLVRERAVTLHSVTPKDLDRMLGENTVHQGVMLEAKPLPEAGLDELGEARLIIMLDQVTDPHNVGAILRTAAAFGVDALIMTARHSPPLQGALAKAASGGLEHVQLVTVPNLARAMAELGELGFMRIGLDSAASGALEDMPGQERLALVFGAEDRGLRRLTAENCDALCAISTTGAIRSLNVSNAAAIALHMAAGKMRNRPGD